MTPCPCCGQLVDTNELLVSLDTNTVSRNGTIVHLSPQLTVLVYILNEARPKGVDHHKIVGAIHGHLMNPSTNDPLEVMRVLLSRTRQLLGNLGIHIVNQRGKGYRMVVDEN